MGERRMNPRKNKVLRSFWLKIEETNQLDELLDKPTHSSEVLREIGVILVRAFCREDLV